MSPEQLETARKLVASSTVRTAREIELLRDPEYKFRMTNSLQEIMLHPDYPREFIAAVAAAAMMMLVEQVGEVETSEDLL